VIKIALGTAILAIVYITFLFFNQMQGLSRSVDAISESSRRLVGLEKVVSALSVNETSLRSFIISGDSMYLKERFYNRAELDPAIAELRKPASPNVKGFNCDSLVSLLDRRYAMFDHTLETIRKYKGKDPKKVNYALAQSDTLTDIVRDYIYRSLAKEASNVTQSSIDHRYEIQTSIVTSFSLVTVALFILLLSIGRISADLRSMKKLNDELKFLNYTFNKAEKIAGISHWKYNLRTKKYIFSDNFFTLIGLERGSFEPSLETILPYIHPDDRDYVNEIYTDSLAKRKPTALVFRLSTKDGMKYVRAIGSFAENSKGELVKIGVNYDITEQYANLASLEESNRNLMAINGELEAFNNIVSHDLQEPLRKIQMFISRIEEQESAALSENGQMYFTRIASSANRMQNLLIDLVNYSRAMKGERAFAPTDLNLVVADVLSELSINIDERQAEVKVGRLPVISAIPTQIHQLFVNLITNSLKFTKPGQHPSIKIRQEKIPDGETREGIAFSDRKYVKLIVSDKGIGFSQEFADKIFLLFRRLEKDSYEGTGIGLSICKRIVENHNGEIFAESQPGKGARFIIYLPKTEG
jgi:signal transduction histidine kinase/CHASE3 domain sensor protein